MLKLLKFLLVLIGVVAAGILGYAIIEWLSRFPLTPFQQVLAVVLVIAVVTLLGYLLGLLNKRAGGK